MFFPFRFLLQWSEGGTRDDVPYIKPFDMEDAYILQVFYTSEIKMNSGVVIVLPYVI